MTRSRVLAAALTALVALALVVGVGRVSRAQPQPQPTPLPLPQRPGAQQLPPGHPPIPNPQPGAQRVPPGGLPPGFRPPGPPGGPRPSAPAPAHEAAHEEPEHCPGHGPMDPPPHINWWQGLIGVNNEKAEKGNAFERLLWRYENPDDSCDEKNQPPPFLASLINFGVLAFIVYHFGKKPLREALVRRKQGIMQEIETAARLRKEAKARLREYKSRSSHLEDTLEEMKSEFATQAELDKKRVLSEAEERRDRMRRDAEFRIEQELKAARIALLHEAVESAVVAAEEMLKSRLEPADIERSAEDYLRSLASAMSHGGAAARPRPTAPPQELGGVS